MQNNCEIESVKYLGRLVARNAGDILLQRTQLVDDRQRCRERHWMQPTITASQTHTRLMALFPGLPGRVGTRRVKPIWILLKQETVSGSGISWASCKSAPHSRQITTPAPRH